MARNTKPVSPPKAAKGQSVRDAERGASYDVAILSNRS